MVSEPRIHRGGRRVATASKLRVFVVALTAAFVALVGRGAAAQTPSEYKVKAAFLYNFAKFVEWPPQVGDEMRLCVLGEDPFGEDLDALAQGKTVQSKWLRVARLPTLDGLEQCHVVFIDAADLDDLSQVLRRAHEAHVLTVGNTHEFADRGGIISFVMESNKVRFEINTASAEQAGLRISSQLLKLAAKVINDPIAPE